MISIESLWNLIDQHVEALPAKEVPLADSAGCVAADDVASLLDLPAFDYSSMDGYAFPEAQPGPWRIAGEVAAGVPSPGPLPAGCAMRISTGGLIPDGTAAVAKQEDCSVADGAVTLVPNCAIAPGENIRRKGAIFVAGQSVLPRGTVLNAGSIALMASCGVSRLRIIPPPQATHLSTGSELVPVGSPLSPGQIIDSNGPMMRALLMRMGIKATTRQLPDDHEALHKAVAGDPPDLLLISGGSGPGDHDHTRSVLESAGYVVHASSINSRPGKPLIFATRGQQVAFGLPGNPLSHWVCFHAFVRRAIARLCGQVPQRLTPAKLDGDPGNPGDGRTTWIPGWHRSEGGECMVTPLPWKHSGDLSPLVKANALILDEPGCHSKVRATFLL